MPEEQAFCVLVKLMYDYGLRDLYKDRFDNLYMRFYQLNRLIEVSFYSFISYTYKVSMRLLHIVYIFCI